MFFRSILASKTITPTYLNPINTAEDLLWSQLDAICTPGTTNYLKASQKRAFQKMKNKIYPELLASLQENIKRFVHNIGYPDMEALPICDRLDAFLPIAFHQNCRAKEGEFVIVADKNWGSMNGLYTGKELIAAKHTSPIIQKNNPIKESLHISP